MGDTEVSRVSERVGASSLSYLPTCLPGCGAAFFLGSLDPPANEEGGEWEGGGGVHGGGGK